MPSNQEVLNDIFWEYDPGVNRILPQFKYTTTEKNVLDSDGTVIFTHGRLTGWGGSTDGARWCRSCVTVCAIIAVSWNHKLHQKRGLLKVDRKRVTIESISLKF